MSDKKTSPRSIKLRTLFVKVLSGKESIVPTNAKLFLEAICDQDNRALCIQKLVGSPHGYGALQSALGSDTASTFLQGPVTSLLRYLEAPELRTVCGGDVLQQLILKFVEVTLVWDAFVKAFKSDELTEEGDIALSWILRELVSLPKEKAITFAPLAREETIRKRLFESTQQEVRLRAQRIVHIVDNLTAKHDNLQNGPGGRHDNDFAEIRKIEILPTSDELAAKDPYLARAHETNERATLSDGLAFHLDGQFRLLREDMLRDLREEVQIALNVKQGRRKGLSIENLTMAGIQCDGRNPWSLQLRCTQDLPQLPNKNEQVRRQYLRDNTKFLRHESVACIMVDGEVVTLGTLIREEDLLAKKPPVLCLQVPVAETEKALRRIKTAKNVKLVQLSTAAFAYVPILKQLKEIKEISFEDDILRWKPGSILRGSDYQLSRELTKLLETLQRDPSHDLRQVLQLHRSTKLDKSQASCFLSGIRQRVSVIQGPPGMLCRGLACGRQGINCRQERGSRSLVP
jgi:hypothetical protein